MLDVVAAITFQATNANIYIYIYIYNNNNKEAPRNSDTECTTELWFETGTMPLFCDKARRKTLP